MGKTFHIITANPEIVIQIQEDPDLKKISIEFDMITPDGVGIVWASRLKRNPVPERVTGFYDQFHLSREFKNYSGYSPGEYKRKQELLTSLFIEK